MIIEEKVEALKTLKNEQKEFVKSICETNAREWKQIQEDNIAVYVFRSKENPDGFSKNGFKLRKVTVVGCVKKEENGTYTLSIGWSRLHKSDNYDRKVGNLIAARRANNPNDTFVFGYYNVRPVVLRNFASPILKENFMPIAASIVEMYEDLCDAETGECVDYSSDFLEWQSCYFISEDE